MDTGGTAQNQVTDTLPSWHMSSFDPTKQDRFTFGLWTVGNPGRDPFGPSVRATLDPNHIVRKLAECGAAGVNLHDNDLIPFGASAAEQDRIVSTFKKTLADTGMTVPMATTNLFSHPVFKDGAFSSNDPKVRAFALQKTMRAIDLGAELGARRYVFWGGREGYQNWLNTDMHRELDHLAAFMHMAVNYAKEIGFTGQFLFEPKPKEPTKHQYDFDAAACINFLRTYGLEDHVKLNLETNHATLAGHSMEHEIDYAGGQGFLGSMDANTGDLLLGWDTDQFPTDIYLTTKCMLAVMKYGGLAPGGVNFDAKVRRESHEPIDLFHAHIGGMDAFARGLKIAAAIRADGRLAAFMKDRYGSWDEGIGKDIEEGEASFASLETYMLEKGDVTPNASGRQEFLENLINEFI
ncbi:MAG TPA: xylose isomerase [Planctomycetes bacterium]|nr:xylose isomerase [Planctomycetota bacterium]